uniref:Uncharacterized protein n=1 Tax=Anguilla anguilla TaxID=7936 RepID=A0A0E9XW59_ANGAN
MWPNTWAT